MKKQNAGYAIDFVHNTITVTAKFLKEAQVMGTTACETMEEIRHRFPDMRIVEKAPRKASSKAQTTYRNMTAYINCIPDNAKYHNMFDAVKRLSLSANSPATFVKKWFFAMFPDFGKMPVFDMNGKPIFHIDEQAGHIIMAELEDRVA